jgi:hypothetical protein
LALIPAVGTLKDNVDDGRNLFESPGFYAVVGSGALFAASTVGMLVENPRVTVRDR